MYHANQHGRPDEPQQARNIMPTIERARVIKRGMEKGAGGIYRILWDTDHYCYRVLPNYELGWQRHNRWNNLLMVE